MRDAERHAPLPRGVLSPWLCCTIDLDREKGDCCCEWLDALRHRHHFLHDCHCFYALQGTDKWTTSAMNVPGYIVCTAVNMGNSHVVLTTFIFMG